MPELGQIHGELLRQRPVQAEDMPHMLYGLLAGVFTGHEPRRVAGNEPRDDEGDDDDAEDHERRQQQASAEDL